MNPAQTIAPARGGFRDYASARKAIAVGLLHSPDHEGLDGSIQAPASSRVMIAVIRAQFSASATNCLRPDRVSE